MHVTRDNFMSSFHRNRVLGTPNRDIKQFLANFPKLPDNATSGQLFDWLHHVCFYSSGYGIFVPPPHTMLPESLLGVWADDLPSSYAADGDYYNNILLQALKGKNVNMNGTKLLKPLMVESDALRLLYRVNKAAGHPALTYGYVDPRPPRQGADVSLLDYQQKWNHYLHISFLRGCFLSDRYYIEGFANHLNNYYATTLRPHIIAMVRTQSINQPVNPVFRPENLLEYLVHIAEHVGLSPLDVMKTPREYSNEQKTRTQSASSRPVRAVATEDSPFPIYSLDALSHLDDDDFAFICQVMAQGLRKCDICKSEQHLVAACPQLLAFKDDPVKTRRLIAILRGMHPMTLGQFGSSSYSTAVSSTRPTSSTGRPNQQSSTPTRSNIVRRIAQDDDTVTDEDESQITALEADDATIGNTDDEADF